MNGCTNALKKLNFLINTSNATLIMQGNINPFQVLNDNNLYISEMFTKRDLHQTEPFCNPVDIICNINCCL